MKSTVKRTLLVISGLFLIPWGATQAQTSIRMEAEDMTLDTYNVEVLDFASNGALINLKGPGYVGSAAAPFPGEDGEYDITVVYHDENDGLAQLSVSINGTEIDSWTLDFKSTESQPQPANRLTRETATRYMVNSGDEIHIDGLQGLWDHANVDYIEFTSTTVLRSESFDTDPGWRSFNLPAPGADFGYRSSDHAGGDRGEIGGIFSEEVQGAYYADTDIGEVQADQPLEASGKLNVVKIERSFNGGFDIAHFNTQGREKIGIAILEPNGWDDPEEFEWRVFYKICDLASGNNDLFYIPDFNEPKTWRYRYDPNDGAFGSLTVSIYGEQVCNNPWWCGTKTVFLTETERACLTSFNAFGLPELGGAGTTIPAQMEFYIDDVYYTVAPRIEAVYFEDLYNTLFIHGEGIQGIAPAAGKFDGTKHNLYRFCANPDNEVTIQVDRVTSDMDPHLYVCQGTFTSIPTGSAECWPLQRVSDEDDNNGIPHGVGGYFADPKTVFLAPSGPIPNEFTLAVFDENDSPLGAPFVPFEIHVNGVTACTAPISIDIKPGSDKNPINLRAKNGTIPVAILTTDTFDATQVDWETVSFGPAGATERHERLHVRDTDGDGDMDAKLHFRTRDTGISCGDTEAMLTGETFAGDVFTGTDVIKIVKCPKPKRR